MKEDAHFKKNSCKHVSRVRNMHFQGAGLVSVKSALIPKSVSNWNFSSNANKPMVVANIFLWLSSVKSGNVTCYGKGTVQIHFYSESYFRFTDWRQINFREAGNVVQLVPSIQQVLLDQELAGFV